MVLDKEPRVSLVYRVDFTNCEYNTNQKKALWESITECLQ